jgi:AcrR family transcriptional regulator
MPKKAYTSEEVNALKTRIMDEASRIMAEKGVANISMRSLAASLNMTAPNLYNYFPNKHELFLETTLRGFSLLSENMEAAVRGIENPRERLRAILKSSLPFAQRWSGYWELIFHPPISLREFAGTPFEDADRLLREKTFSLMMESVADVAEMHGEVNSAIPIRAITAMTNVHGLIDLYNHRILEQFGEGAEKMVEMLIDQSLDLLFPLQEN